MLTTYLFRAKDPSSDHGHANVTVIAESEQEASNLVEELAKSKGKANLCFECYSAIPFKAGILSSTIEENVLELETFRRVEGESWIYKRGCKPMS